MATVDNEYGDSSEKVKMELPYDPAIPHLGRYQKKKKFSKTCIYTPTLIALLQKDTCMPIFMAVLFLSVKNVITQVSINI